MTAALIEDRIEAVLERGRAGGCDDSPAHAQGTEWGSAVEGAGSAEMLARHLGATIEDAWGGITPVRYAVSEFFTRGRRIVVYRDTVAALAYLVESFGIGDWFETERLREIALAHECFHLLEEMRRLPRRRYRRAAERETAANAFAQGFHRLSRSPAILSELLPLHLARGNASAPGGAPR
jgi:hypothetical protein